MIIAKLTTTPILGVADPKLPYILHTSYTLGLGPALYQEQQERKRVIAYASQGLSKCESRYPTHKSEFLALKWAVMEKFQDYLCGSQFLDEDESESGSEEYHYPGQKHLRVETSDFCLPPKPWCTYQKKLNPRKS